jgi:hypothetical protein
MTHHACKTCWSRRDFLFRSGGGISGLALAHLLNQDHALAEEIVKAGACDASPTGFNPYAPKAPHFKPRATSVISLFMSGGVSQVDTFDPKPALAKCAGQPLDGKVAGDVIVRQDHPGPLMPSRLRSEVRQSGMEVSDLFRTSAHVDDIAFVRSVYGQSNDHVRRPTRCRPDRSHGFPEPGSWVTYGLGSSEPAGVRTIRDGQTARSAASTTGARASSRGLPEDAVPLVRRSDHRQAAVRGQPGQQRTRLDLLAKLNRLDMQQYPGSSIMAAASSWLAYRMQGCAPRLDIGGESGSYREAVRTRRAHHRAVRRQC